MLHFKNLAGIIFFIFIFTISIQLNKFFWTDFSYVNGVRVDYLAPALYLSDFFAVLFIGLSIISNFKGFKKFLSKSVILPWFLLAVLVSSLLAQNASAAFYWSLKIVEVVLLGWAISNFEFRRKDIRVFTSVLVLSALLQSAIAILQSIYQKSLGGPLYFLGERTFDVHTIGIATFYSNGQEFLRSYGTFPHPNVLSFFLTIALFFLIYTVLKEKTKQSVIYSLSALPIVLALLLASSRVSLFLITIATLFMFIKSKKNLTYLLIAVFFLFPLYFSFFSGRFLTVESIFGAVNIRIAYIQEGFGTFLRSPIFGLGPNNTFFATNSLPIFARFQPAHNIYLHLLFQIGIVGFIPVVLFLIKVTARMLKSLKNKNFFQSPVSILALQILIIGFFDHYFITVQQGLLMIALILGLFFNKSMERELG